MSIRAASRGSVFVSGLYSSNTNRVLQGANVYFEDSNADTVEMDAVTLRVLDANNLEQYTLTEISDPVAIVLEEPALVYVVETLDVTGFPSGNITLNWTGTLDGYDYTATQTVEFGQSPSIVLIEGESDTLQDQSVVLGQAKTFTVRIRDSIGNPVDGLAVQGVIYDREQISETAYSATLKAAGTGLWYFTQSLSAQSFSADLDRYELYWRIQFVADGAWFEVENSRTPLRFYSLTGNVNAGPITYNSNQDLRLAFPNIDEFLQDVVVNQGERELWLNQKRKEVGILLSREFKNTRARASRDALELLANYEVFRLVLLNATGKSGATDKQLKAIDQQISRIRNNIYGPISTIRIGPRLSRF